MHDLIIATDGIMVGIIWVVQLILYPTFAHVDVAQWESWHSRHMRSIGPIVAPVMLVQLVLSIYWAGTTPNVISLSHATVIIGTWLCTALVQVPLHRALRVGHHSQSITRLIRTNWLRTTLWTVALALAILG